MKKIYSSTTSLCPECNKKVSARIMEEEEQIFLEKFCPEHGISKGLVCSDVKWYQESQYYVKPGQIPLKYNTTEYKGCPDSCGFCPEHQQHTCLPVIEITNKCDLDCPICLKPEDANYMISVKDFENILNTLLESEEKVDVINISGGEPTMHPELETMLEMANSKGITQVSVSTDGLILLKNKPKRDVFKKTGAIVALQFDGFSETASVNMRGENLIKGKLELIRLLEEEEINYSLVATIAKGENDTQIQKITDFFFESKALTLMFQPITFTGHAKDMDVNKMRLTIPDVVKEIRKSDYVGEKDFNPLPCSHYLCFALAYYLKIDDGKYFSMKEFLGEENFLNVIANKTLPGLEQESMTIMKQQIFEFWSASDSGNLNENVLKRIRSIISEMNSPEFNSKKALQLGAANMKAIFIHHFMDAHNFDFARLVKCCNPYPRADGKLIPICAANIC